MRNRNINECLGIWGRYLLCILLSCYIWWCFVIILIYRQHHSLMLKFGEGKHLVCMMAQPDLAAAEVSEEMLICYFRLLTNNLAL